MTITAKLIADSNCTPTGVRLSTFQLRYPRFIHSEVMTHRVLSRSASSSRAIPVERLIQDVLDDTAKPLHWGKNQKGMQADEECNEPLSGSGVSPYNTFDNVYEDIDREDAWKGARDKAIKYARAFDKAGYHKQIVNRLLEPFAHINVVVTATDWNNLFHLRDHKDAQPEFQVLARRMKLELAQNTPRELAPGGWHLPYITETELLRNQGDQLACISAARCARVSYLTHDGREPNIAEDMKLFERLVGSEPEHASPLEHPAQAQNMPERFYNLTGWKNFRFLWDSSKVSTPKFSHYV